MNYSNLATFSSPPPVIIHKTNYYKLAEKNATYASIKFILECCHKLECK